MCLCAALLHDIGHGPFSHSVESAFDVHHETWSCRIIEGDTEVNRVLASVSPDFPSKVSQVISKTYPKPIVVSLISSQMDADRMDYLLRDAYFTGVNYGSFDLERILRMLRPYKGNIVVKESGMHAVEHYLMSRYQMYWQVYFHPVTRSSEIILRKIFARAKELYQQGHVFSFMLEPLPKLFANELTVQDYLLLDEALLHTVMMRWTVDKDPILADLCSRFLYRKLFKYEPITGPDDPAVHNRQAMLAAEGLDLFYYMEIDFPTDHFYDVYRPGESGTKSPILLLTEKDEIVEISEKSEIVRSISAGPLQGSYQLYYPVRE